MDHVNNTQFTLGIGCDRHTPATTIAAAVESALIASAVQWQHIICVATVDRKANEPGLLAFVAQHGWILQCYTAAQLAQVPVSQPSAIVQRHIGTPSVSAAAALLAAGTFDQYALRLEKYRWRDVHGYHVTVSIAALPNNT